LCLSLSVVGEIDDLYAMLPYCSENALMTNGEMRGVAYE
jgi:hypothetical protein